MDAMLDIETFGVDSNSVVVSISAVVFDRESGENGATFEIGVDIKEQLDNGAVIDGDTIMWWLGQNDDARNQLTRMKKRSVGTALKKFTKFCAEHDVKCLWGNGATFDNVIVRNLYKRHGYEFPTPFWSDRDVRTAVDLNNIDTREFEFVGTKHNGLDDCRHQIKYMTKG